MDSRNAVVSDAHTQHPPRGASFEAGHRELIHLDAAELIAFQQVGYLLVRGLLDETQTEWLRKIARKDRQIESDATARSDSQGGQTVLAVRDSLSDDIYSAIVRSDRISGIAAELIGDEVYHYHHKLMLKEPRVGGAWEWHQDYGYWYNFGCLYPDMLSCYFAIDAATKQNGCLQIIPGSHHLGRIDHGKVGGQTGADPERVDAVLQRSQVMHVEMQPGDALYFHANLLHRSDRNTSEDPRWGLICCYNTRHNDPYVLKRHNAYTALQPIPHAAIEQAAHRQWERLT